MTAHASLWSATPAPRERPSGLRLVARRRAPRVVVVIPAYEAGETIAAVAKGFLRVAQEVIVVDDGSRDNTSEAVSTLRHPRLHLVKSAYNGGVGAATKLGIPLALALGADIIVKADGTERADGPCGTDCIGSCHRSSPAKLTLRRATSIRASGRRSRACRSVRLLGEPMALGYLFRLRHVAVASLRSRERLLLAWQGRRFFAASTCRKARIGTASKSACCSSSRRRGRAWWMCQCLRDTRERAEVIC